MSGNEIVKLYVYQETPEETIIDSFDAEDFGDFRLIYVDADITDQEMRILQEGLADATEKKTLVIPRGFNLKFYGVRPAND